MENIQVEEFYNSRIKKEESAERRLKGRSRFYLYAKLISFLGAAVWGYYAYIDENFVETIIALVCLIFYIFVFILDDRCIVRISQVRELLGFCRKEVSALGGDYSSFDSGKEYINPQHEYSYDLDVFGEKSLYQRINRTVTKIGRDRLAEKLAHLNTDKKNILEAQEAIVDLAKMDDWRLRFLVRPFVESYPKQLSSVVGQDKYGFFIMKSKLPYVMIIATLIILVLAILSYVAWSFFFMMFAIQVGVTISVGRMSSKVSGQTNDLHKEFKGYLVLIDDIVTANYSSAMLRDLQHGLSEDGSNSAIALHRLSSILNLFNQRSNELMCILLNGLFLYDVLLIRMFARWSERYMPHVDRWLDCIAEIDALVSMGNYAANHPQNVEAEILNEGENIIVEGNGIYHPFLQYEKAVPNDFRLSKTEVAIVTGANMAGKSTFLRTLGVSFIMACNGIPVCAKSFRFSVVSLFSSMRTADDLSKDISYFNAELLRLQQLVRHVKSHPYTLVILDEILKGTNSRDKLKGSIMFLEEISKQRVGVVVATHDLELSDLEKQHPKVYHNYCFEIELSEHVKYSYKIKRGVAHNLNASYLLSGILKELGNN